MSKTINIAKEFTTTPGARYVEDGPFSGEEFRTKFLEPLFSSGEDDTEITIILDGTEGYPTSFLEEAFGGIARKYGRELCLKRLRYVSEEDKLLVDEIQSYIKKCND